ncbi:hypothetical protein [Streptomyces sp. SUK 48]|uniref:hypothetical protein n=1 Tax=Streptomyces sp. SUK 48 TaxID=2582831 RepID=UPI001FB99272|nr:hypothetical protein [Streptomyces sp. SUK 48]
MMDTSRGRVGEFRGVVGPHWALRPVGGGREWEADSHLAREADDGERTRVMAARAAAQSRGER